ncbi:MAG: ATPase, partial [Thermoplasmata archaeon]
IIEKTPKDSIRIFLTYYDNYETKVKQLSSDEVEEVLTYDPFLNLDHFLEEGKK